MAQRYGWGQYGHQLGGNMFNVKPEADGVRQTLAA